MSKTLKNFETIHFYKSLIAANNVITPVQKEIPTVLLKYKADNIWSFQDWGDFIIKQKFKQSVQHID